MPFSSVLGASTVIKPGVCTSSTRPASPFDGQVIYETDTDRTLVYNGTGWVFLSTSRANPVGIDLIKTQTIGSAVSSVTVTNAFNSTYDNYKITVNGGVTSANNALRMTLGSSSTGYYGNLIYARPNNTSVLSAANNNTAYWEYAGLGNANGFACQMEIASPFLSYRTSIFSAIPEFDPAGVNSTYCGWHNVTSSYTDFTFTASVGTITGGTIAVYGYAK
jgi:hypothetical protein